MAYLFILVHPYFCKSHVILANGSLANLVWLALSEHVTYLGTRKNFQGSPAHPNLKKRKFKITAVDLRGGTRPLFTYFPSPTVLCSFVLVTYYDSPISTKEENYDNVWRFSTSRLEAAELGTYPEGNFDVFSSPVRHLSVIRTNFIEIRSGDSKQSTSHSGRPKRR